eukprot:1585880-Rhodomonas_salina.1
MKRRLHTALLEREHAHQHNTPQHRMCWRSRRFAAQGPRGAESRPAPTRRALPHRASALLPPPLTSARADADANANDSADTTPEASCNTKTNARQSQTCGALALDLLQVGWRNEQLLAGLDQLHLLALRDWSAACSCDKSGHICILLNADMRGHQRQHIYRAIRAIGAISCRQGMGGPDSAWRRCREC